ncbi:uncharacterized protein LOC117174530 isoform X2 [Belonocnema kinseyi]|uniref:uncharacterized protein LOC117174530 isoform X2 n=1 Tax=Belonocnema kinseyi TaxID=2817044 RepID=UPI00143DCA3E|nr:uncharacterized protein LOC117174530 isoform X2 [Belonocnema kinseyi]
MSEFSKDASRSLLSPPRSLMNLEDAEEVWTIITKRYPKAAPLLCEMESVLDHAEDLLEQLKSPSDLGIVFSTEESLNDKQSEETVSDQSNLCDQSLAKDDVGSIPSVLETEVYNLDYLTLTETAYKNNKVSFINEDSKTNTTLFCTTSTVSERDSFFDEPRDDELKDVEKSLQQHSEDCKKTECLKSATRDDNDAVNYNKGSRPSSASKIFGKSVVPRLPQSPRRQRTHSEGPKIDKNAIPKSNEGPRKHSSVTGVSIPHFKKVIETIKSKEMAKKSEILKTEIKPQEKLEEVTDIIRMKIKDSASIDDWDKIVGNSSKSCETSALTNTFTLDRNCQSQLIISPDRFINKTNDSETPTTKPIAAEANFKIQSKLGNNQKTEKTVKTENQGCGDEKNSVASFGESPVIILEQYGKICNKKIDYNKNDDRKGKIEITCSFANYRVSSAGKILEIVKNEAAARMLHMLAISQMEEKTPEGLKEFSRQEMLEIMNLNKRDTFIHSVKKVAMVKLYNFCLEENLPEPVYDVKPDKQCGFLSICRILEYIGQGSGRAEGTAKEKAAEDFYKKHFQKLKNELKDQ